MEKKLTEGQTRGLMAMARERDRLVLEINDAIDEMLKAWAGNIKDPRFEQRPDGVYIVEKKKEEAKEEDQTEAAE